MKVCTLYIIVEVEQDCSAEILRTKFNWRVSCKQARVSLINCDNIATRPLVQTFTKTRKAPKACLKEP